MQLTGAGWFAGVIALVFIWDDEGKLPVGNRVVTLVAIPFLCSTKIPVFVIIIDVRVYQSTTFYINICNRFVLLYMFERGTGLEVERHTLYLLTWA